MSETKVDAKKAAASKKAAAARAETNDEPKTVNFRGIELKLPAKLPGTVLFDVADIDAGRDLRGTMEFLKSLIGEGQYEQIREKVRADGIALDEVEGELIKLIEGVLDASGLGQGE